MENFRNPAPTPAAMATRPQDRTPEQKLIVEMAELSMSAQGGGWNVAVRDVPTNHLRRRMDGVKDGIWFRLEIHADKGKWIFRIRHMDRGAITYRLGREGHVLTALSGRALEQEHFLPARVQLRDKEIPLHLR